MASVLKASYGKLLSIALTSLLVLAVYAPTQMPFPQVMAATIEITNQTTCEALPEEVSPEWTDPICEIDSGSLVVDNILRVHQSVVLEITFNSGLQINAGATLDNDGNITNHGTIFNSGTIDNAGTFTNHGTIENECDVGVVLGEISENQPEDGCGLEGPLTGSISGVKFIDEDGDGEWDSEVDEETLGGVTICAFAEEMETEVCDETDPETGEYLLEDLPLDVELEIYEEVPGGYIQTAPVDFEDETLFAEDGTYFITLDSSETVEDLDFGNQPVNGAIIGNGQVILGVDEEGQLNVQYRGVPDLGLPEEDPIDAEESEEGELPIGLRNGSGEYSAVEQGSPSEGWGIAGNASSGSFSAYANNNEEDSVFNLEVESFAGQDGGETAESVVIVYDSEENPVFSITHNFEPSAETLDLYKITVTVENIGEVDVNDVIYRRVMDWDIDPTPFDEFVTIHGAENNTLVLNSGNNGFIGMDILEASDPEDFVEEYAQFSIEDVYKEDFVDLGPADHGAAFDFDLGDIPAGESASMTIFYGAAINEESALDALDAEDVQMYSLGQSTIFGDEESDDVPNNDGALGPTFMFAFGEITEADDGINSPPDAVAGPDQTVDDSALVTLDGTGSSDEETEDLEYSWTRISGPAVTLTGNTTANPTFTAPSNINTELVFNLTVTDDDGASDSDTVSVTVQGRGDITIRKVEQGTGALLNGSAFRITPDPFTLTGNLVVVDNGPNDSNSTLGIIKISNVRFSSYTLVESQVPAGYAKIVNSLNVVVNSGNNVPVVTVQNLNVEEEIEEAEVPPPQLDDEQVDDLRDNGAEVDGEPVNNTNLPPAVITPPGQTPQVPKPVVFTNPAPLNTAGSSLFASFSIPTYQAPVQSIANQTIYSPPAFVVPKANGSNFVLTPIIEEIFEGMTMLLTPPNNTAVTSASIQSVEIEFGQGGNDTGFSFDLSADVPEDLPELDDIEEAALFLDVDFVGSVNFSDPNVFGSPPEFVISVSRTLGGEDLPDGCPAIELYLLNENTDEWEVLETPERNPDGDTASECSYIVHTEHFSKFTIGSVKASISGVADGPGGGGSGGSRTVSVDGTFGAEYFEVHPLSKVSISGTSFIGPDGRSDNTFVVGEQVHFTNTIRNHQRDPQSYIFIVQVLDSDGITQSMSWQSGLLDRAQEFELGQSWLAEVEGDYQVRIYVWNGWEAPDPLSNVTVKVLKVTNIGPSQSA